ncbi:hypothetical protein DW909_07985 [Bifidobacterium bifidum]|nr:hypothetical protein DW909_07985 [Bifidobacterium bifidum]
MRGCGIVRFPKNMGACFFLQHAPMFYSRITGSGHLGMSTTTAPPAKRFRGHAGYMDAVRWVSFSHHSDPESGVSLTAATVLRQCLSKSSAISCALSHGRSPCSSGSRLHGLAWCTVKPQRRSSPVSMMWTNTGPPQNGQSGSA